MIETLIAVSVLMIAIAGPLTLVQAGLFSSIHQRNQVTATYLAQEALEYVKNIRDTNFYTNYGDSSAWLNLSSGSSVKISDVCAVGCYVDPHGKLPGSSVNSADGNNFVHSIAYKNDLTLSSTKNSSGIFAYSYDSTGSSTPYRRIVKIENVGTSGTEIRVSVTVDWKDNSLPRSYTVKENIYNYQQQNDAQ